MKTLDITPECNQYPIHNYLYYRYFVDKYTCIEI